MDSKTESLNVALQEAIAYITVKENELEALNRHFSFLERLPQIPGHAEIQENLNFMKNRIGGEIKENAPAEKVEVPIINKESLAPK